jgi:hypothetical protein
MAISDQEVEEYHDEIVTMKALGEITVKEYKKWLDAGKKRGPRKRVVANEGDKENQPI